MSVFFLRVFEGAVNRISVIGASPFLSMVLILAWLRTGQRIDSHMGTLGLTVAQAGNGLYGDMMAGAAVAKSVGRKASSAVTTATGAKAAGGLGAYLASQEGRQRFGGGVNRLARAAQSAGGQTGAQSKINTAKFDAMNSGIGVNRGQSAINGIQAKYGDAKNKDNPDGKSLNELLNEGGAIKSASMTADGSGEATVVDKNGNELTMAFGSDQNGDAVVGYQGNEDALKNAMGPEAEGDMNANDVMNAVGGEEMATSNLDAEGDCVKDEDNNIVAGGMEEGDLSGLQTDDGQDITGLADESGMVAAGTAITDEDGNTIGIADGEGNMMTEGSFATDTDGNFQDVTGMAGINADGQAIDADGNVMTDADGNAIQMADVGAAGSVGINEDGQFVDANDNPMVDENGDALMATSDVAMAADGSVFAKGEDGQYHAMTDSDGNAVQLGDNQALSVGADGNISGISEQGVDGGAYQAVNGADGSALGISSSMQDDNGNSVDMAAGALSVADSVDAGIGNMAVNEDGAMVGISNSIGEDGQISSSAVSSDAQGSFITADDGSRVAVSGDETSGYSVSGGTFAEANGNIKTNTPNENGTPGMAAVSGGAIAGGVTASLASGVSTYNKDSQAGGSIGSAGGAYAMTSGGMVSLGNSIDSNGHVTAAGAGVGGGNITPNSNGDGGYSMNVNGSAVAVKKDNSSPTGYSIAGSTYSKADGTSGAYAVGKNASGSSMLVQTNGNGGVNRYSQTQSGSLSLSGNSGAITHSYSQATGSSGGYVKDKHGGYQSIYSGAGGTTSSGSPQLYKSDGNGGYTPISSTSELGKGESAFARTSANNTQGYNYTNIGSKGDLPKDGSCPTYNQTGSYYNGVNVSKNNDGSYGINLSRGASAHSYGNGVIDVNTGNGSSVRLLDAAIHQAPAGAMTTTFNGKSYYATTTSSAAVGHIGGQSQTQMRQNAQSLVNSCNDGGVRDYFQGKYNKGNGIKSNSAANSVIDHKNGSFTIASSNEAGKDKKGNTSYKAMTFYPTDKFQTNNPDAKRVSFKGKEYIAVESRKTGGSIVTSKGAGISTRKDTPDPSQFGSFALRREINYVNKGMNGAKTARQKKIDNIDRQEGRR